MDTYLMLNGFEIAATVDEQERLMLDLAAGRLTREQLANWLEQHLQKYAGTIIAVTHDRYFLDNVAGWILELDRGEGIPWKGNYSSWLDQKQKRMAQEEKSESKRQKALERELEWVRKMPRARGTKSKSRLQAFDTIKDFRPFPSQQRDIDLRFIATSSYGFHPQLGCANIDANAEILDPGNFTDDVPAGSWLKVPAVA